MRDERDSAILLNLISINRFLFGLFYLVVCLHFFCFCLFSFFFPSFAHFFLFRENIPSVAGNMSIEGRQIFPGRVQEMFSDASGGENSDGGKDTAGADEHGSRGVVAENDGPRVSGSNCYSKVPID